VTGTPTRDRLPRAALSGRTRAGEVLRGLVAAGVLLAVLGGVPWALATLVGNPLPTTVPDRSWLDAELSTTAVLDVLAVVLWLLWLHFVVCVLLELHAWASGAPSARAVLGGPAPLLARRLVAAVLLVAAGTVPVAAPALALEHAPVATATPEAGWPAGHDAGWPAGHDAGWPAGHEAGAARTVVGGDAGPATTATPDPARSVPSATPVTPTVDDASPEARGLVVYVVQPPNGRHHDCLWDIAERTLGDPLRHREVFELNRDRVQADGSRFSDADLVRPGWTLLLPADAVVGAATATPGGA
jgi:hypothetical protein